MTSTETTMLVNQAEQSFSQLDTIQAVIASMDSENSAVVNATNNVWKFRYGTVDVAVSITGDQPSDTFTVIASVMTLPAEQQSQLFRLLLEKNAAETFEARFAIQGNQIIVVCSRSVEDLSAAEISRIITIVATIADQSDEELKSQFPA